MRSFLSTLAAIAALATAPSLALAGPTDAAGSAASTIPATGTAIIVAPTTSIPLPTCGELGCSLTRGAVTFYPPSPCSPDGAGACTSIRVTVPTEQ